MQINLSKRLFRRKSAGNRQIDNVSKILFGKRKGLDYSGYIKLKSVTEEKFAQEYELIKLI